MAGSLARWLGGTRRRGVVLSVLVPLGGRSAAGLARSLASLGRLGWRRWEICVAASAGTRLTFGGTRASGVRIAETPGGGGRAAAYQACLAQAAGRYVCLLEPGEELEPRGVARAIRLLERDPGLDLVYGDEDRVAATGVRHTPFLRPDWSPDYLLGALYVERAFVVRRDRLLAAGGFRPEYDPAPEWDLLLRVTEKGGVVRLPEVLVHRPGEPRAPWREADPARVAAGARAVAEACRRRAITAEVVPQAVPGTYRVRRAVPPVLVSVVVPFRDGAVLLRRCVESVLASSGRVAVEVVLVDNGSTEDETRRLLERLAADARVRTLSAPGPFNYAALVNRGAAAASGDVLCLLNSDVEACTSGWLEALLGQAVRPEVGAVGAKLLYPDGSVQHAGIVLGVLHGTGHAQRFRPGDHPGYFANAAVVREVSAVTGACLATRREVFERVGGFDEALPVAYNDVDFCLRVTERGWRVLYTPDAELVHHEGASRGREDAAREALAHMRRRWGPRFAADPYYHPGLDAGGEDGAPMPPRPAPYARRFRRVGETLAWLGEWSAVLRARSRPAGPTALALVAGSPVVHPGRPNRYWIRLVNTEDQDCEMRLEVVGRLRSDGQERRFEWTGVRSLAPGAVDDLCCETGWDGRVAVVPAVVPFGGCDGARMAGTCELVVTVRRGPLSETARIAQRVGS